MERRTDVVALLVVGFALGSRRYRRPILLLRRTGLRVPRVVGRGGVLRCCISPSTDVALALLRRGLVARVGVVSRVAGRRVGSAVRGTCYRSSCTSSGRFGSVLDGENILLAAVVLSDALDGVVYCFTTRTLPPMTAARASCRVVPSPG
jgi:hypothetical protein